MKNLRTHIDFVTHEKVCLISRIFDIACGLCYFRDSCGEVDGKTRNTRTMINDIKKIIKDV